MPRCHEYPVSHVLLGTSVTMSQSHPEKGNQENVFFFSFDFTQLYEIHLRGQNEHIT